MSPMARDGENARLFRRDPVIASRFPFRIILACAALMGCYHLMRPEMEKHVRSARLGTLDVREKIGVGDKTGALATLEAVEINLDTAIDITGRKLSREDIPPCIPVVARYERRVTLKKKAKLDAMGAAIATRTWDLIAGASAGGGILAAATAWALKNRRTVKRMASYIIEDGKKEIAGAKDPAKAEANLKQRQEDLHIRAPVREVLKNV